MHNFILVDEDSEIILTSTQTPFNVGDEKQLIDLINKAEEDFELKPEEITTDRVYGTTENRAYLKDNEIKSNIGFYNNSEREYKVFNLTKFDISEDLKSAKCPDGKISIKCTVSETTGDTTLKFDKKTCMNCPLKDQCLSKKDSKSGRRLILSTRYDAIVKDIHNSSTLEFQIAQGKRYIVERRFATMVLNHGLRRCRYLRLERAKIHITMANIASNVVRMVNLLFKDERPSLAM